VDFPPLSLENLHDRGNPDIGRTETYDSGRKTMEHAEKRSCGFEFRLFIRHEPPRIPSAPQRCEELGKFAKLLESVGLGMSQWLVSGDSTVPAFDSKGPTAAFIKSADDDPESPIQFADVWNGLEGKGAAGLTLKYRKRRRSGFDFRAVEIAGLEFYESVADLVEGALGIWPSLLVEVSPYAYSASEKVFPDRPGDVSGTVGTIIVSEIDGPFDVNNRAHVKTANDIEIRLADQDLLPLYVDL
jgi:hypothetical protein